MGEQERNTTADYAEYGEQNFNIKCNVIIEMQYLNILMVCLAMGEQGESMPIFQTSEELSEWLMPSGHITSQSG